MVILWVLTLCAAAAGIDPAVQLATWFGQHVLLTILLLLLLG